MDRESLDGVAKIGRPSWLLLDRDGTINVKADEGAYVLSPNELVLQPGAAEAIRRCNDERLPVIVVTNQRGVARGLMTMADVAAVHDRLQELLAAFGAHVDAFYVCPHENGACDCRKPLPGLLTRAAREQGLDLAAAAMIGDAETDVEAGLRAGTTTVRLGIGVSTKADLLAPDLAAAIDLLLGDDHPTRGSRSTQ